MGYNKTIVCLAKSDKHNGYCIAGRELDGGRYGGWVRPVSDRKDEEITISECKCGDGNEARLLDIINIPMLEPRSHGYQRENHLIDSAHQWRRQRRLGWTELESLVDHVQGPLWLNGYSTAYGINDQVPENLANGFDYSLLLIKPTAFEICVETEGIWYPKRKIRAAFKFNGVQYKLPVTDPTVKKKFWTRPGQHPFGDEVLTCVSLGEVYKGYAYKLIAAVLTPDICETR